MRSVIARTQGGASALTPSPRGGGLDPSLTSTIMWGGGSGPLPDVHHHVGGGVWTPPRRLDPRARRPTITRSRG